MLRSLLVSALGVVLVGAYGAASASAVYGAPAQASSSGGTSLLGGALMAPSVDQLLGGEGARLARAARREDPSAVAARAAARTTFTGLSRQRTADVAKAAFPELIEQAATGIPSLPAGRHVVRYPTNHAAEVSLPGAKGVIESIAPIARDSHGRHVPLDLRLTETGTGFSPARSDVALRVPRRVSDGVSLPALGVSLTPIDGSGAALAGSEGALDGAGVLWRFADSGAEGAQDTAAFAKARPDGFDLTTLLLSRRSSGRLRFRVGMPSGARLKQERDGSVRIIDGPATVAIVSPVSAEDAEGTNVPVLTSVRGDRIELRVDLAGDYLYPIAVDPEVNDAQLATNPGNKRSNWEFFTSNAARFGKNQTYEGPGKERLETYGKAEYAPAEWAYWGYQTHGVSHLYEIKTETSAHNKLAKIESFLEFLEPGGARETKKMLSNEFETPEYEKRAVTACAANASKVEECLPGSGKAGNSVHFQQSATGSPGGNYAFSDVMTQGIVSIAEPAGTHSATGYNTTAASLEFETEVEGKKEKVTRQNVLAAGGGWLTKHSGAFQMIATDPGIGVAATKLEYESAPESWTPLFEHNYLNVENACQGVQCYPSHAESATLPLGLPDGEQKIRYKAEEAISGTQSLSTEGKTTVKVDTKAPYNLSFEGLPFGDELAEKPYTLTVEATDGEGATVVSSGIKQISLLVDGHEFGTASPGCSVAKGPCTVKYSWTVNGAELGAGQHDIELIATDHAGNEIKTYEPITIRHSTPIALGPGSVDLESGDFTLAGGDVSFGSGLSVARNYSSRASTAALGGPFGPEWGMGLSSTESLVEMVNGSVIMTAADGSKSIFAALGEGKFQAPTGDSNLELSLEENKVSKQKLAYYLKDSAAHTSVKFTQPSGAAEWVPTQQEGTVANQTVTYSYQIAEALDEYKLATNAEPYGLTKDSEGNLWFTEEMTGKIGKVTPSGGVTEYATGSGSWVTQIAIGPDGNIWFTNANSKKVGKMTPSGTVLAEYAAGEGNINGIINGPGGYLWFISSAGKIEKISTSGTITAYPVPEKTSPSRLTVGPDGNVWYSNNYCGWNSPGACSIGKMTPTGAVTEYPVPGNVPEGITTGPEGNLWYTGLYFSNASISKMTTAGVITNYPLAENARPSGVTVGADGNIWFAEHQGNRIGRITKAGVVSEYSLPAGSEPQEILSGSNGNLWFTEQGSDRIGTLSTAGRIAEPVEELAPKPAGVSCTPTLKPGCRALKFKYATETTAAGEAPSEWGQFQRHLTKIMLAAYDPVSKAMKETAVAEYAYDRRGRLRAEWDPRVSPALKTTIGYDEEGRVTALSPPGQESWSFTYGTSAGDAGTGRLLKLARASASTELWKGEALSNTEAPKITGAAAENTKLAVSTGTWSGSPLAYGYQWSRCNTTGVACVPIPGATNANYTPGSQDAGHMLRASVIATNAGGSVTAGALTAIVQSAFGAWKELTLASSSGPTDAVKGIDNYMWFTEFTSNRIAKASAGGVAAEYPLPAGSGPTDIVSGPDYSLWYTDFTSSKIGRMTIVGSGVEYPLPAGSGPKGIVVGPDSNIWFTNYTSSKIGKITSGGAITEYALPAGSHPEGIAVGADGNLWFTDHSTNKVGKITTTGTITEYTLPPTSAPNGIARGADGNMWFTEAGLNKVGKLTPAGGITQYATPVSTPVEYLVLGAEGYLWGTSTTANKLVKIAPTGTMTAFSHAGSGTGFQKPVVGNENMLWFGELTSSKLAIVNPTLFGEGAAVAPQPGETINYAVPVSGAGAPHAMSASEVAKWGQSDVPDAATAITPVDEPQSWPASSYKRATVYYLDEHGRQVNVASPNSAASGSISTTEYNEYNDVIRTLTPDNRATALAAGAGSAEVSKLLDTQSTYNGEGAKEGEVSEPGTRLIESFGPQHTIKYRAGNETKESLARDHKEYFYDQGAPGGEKYRLLTETADLARLANHEDVEVRTVRTGYSGQGNLGWKLRAPTSVTVLDAEGQTVAKTTTEYNPTTAQVTESRGTAAESTLSYATGFGQAGSEAGKLKSPWGVAVNGEGKLWVVDTANNRVEEFNAEGGYLGKFGEAGSGAGQLSSPQGIALDSAGHIWVADTANNRIEEFSATGTYMATVGSLGSEAGKLKAPAALAFDTTGNLWVADTANSRIEKFDKEGKYVSQFGSHGTEPGQLAEPRGIAVGSGERIWVADTANNRIQEFSTSGNLLKRFGTPGAGEGQLNTPVDLKLDSSGNVWTVDTLNSRAESFTPSGAFVTQIGWKGSEAGRLTEPRGLAFDASGKVWVTDSSDNRLEQWSKGPNAHEGRTIYYSSEANTEGFSACGSHPEWAGLLCERLPGKQPELMGLPKLPVTTYTYNMLNEPETTTETFGATTRTKKDTYDAAGRHSSSETTASTGVSLPKVSFTYNSEFGALERQTTEGEGRTLTSEFNRLGQLVKYTDADGNSAKYTYAGPQNDFMLEEASDSSAGETSKQTYEYDATTKLRTKLIDSAAGSFTAAYDVEGKLLNVAYPYGMCASYAYNAVGEATGLRYLKTSNCAESEPGIWYSDSRVSSVRGEMLSQTSTLASESYAYDAVGRLLETQETPEGEGCSVRSYAYDQEANRATLSTRSPGVGGTCQAEGGTTEGHNYDEGNRLADGGMAYDGLGNITKLPAVDAGGKELTSSYYVDNAVATQTQGGVTNSYALDPEGRVRETSSESSKIKNHYDGQGEAVAWTESAEQSTRNIAGIDGALLATQTNGATPVLQLHDLQGDVVATIGDQAGETKLLSSYNSTEFGVPSGGKAPPKFAYLGAFGVESSLPSGVITYGATSYVPQTGRPLQSEAVEAPGLAGGSGAGAAYSAQEDPWNMQGAAGAAAEAPGLEAAREQAAMEAALGSVVDPWVYHVMNRSKAYALAVNYFEAESAAVVLEMFDLPADFLELAGKLAGEFVSQFDDAYKWLYDAGNKLRKCSENKRKSDGRDANICYFFYEQDEWTPGIWTPFGTIHPVGTLTWPDFSKEPQVNECLYVKGPSLVCLADVHIETEL